MYITDMHLFDQATDPKQYDSIDVDWSQETGLASPMRAFYWKQLNAHIPFWTGKSVLDIGAGSGWLLEQALLSGASQVVGLEPSEHNASLSGRSSAQAHLLISALETYVTNDAFDIVTSVMSLCHIKDLPNAFRNVASLLKGDGSMHAIVPDYDYFRLPKYGRAIQVERISEDECVVSTVRSSGSIADVIRKTDTYVSSAQDAGLICVTRLGLKPDAELIAKRPKYQEFAHMPFFQYLQFKKR